MPQVESNIIESRVKRFEETCRAKGLKITHQRLEVFRELAASVEHPSAEQIYERIRKRLPTISLDTVYRSLATLNESGVVARVEVLDDRCRFDANTDRHHHFVCTECLKVIDFLWPGFDSLPIPDDAKKLGIVQTPQAEIRGICSECSKKRL